MRPLALVLLVLLAGCSETPMGRSQLALMPEVSGNTINGLGEAGKRKASPIYWHEPDTLAHGELQKWFYTQNADDPHIIKSREDIWNWSLNYHGINFPKVISISIKHKQFSTLITR